MPEGSGFRRVATLASPDSALAVSVYSDQPGLQVYTGNFLDGNVPGTSRSLYRQGDGVALEPEPFPDSPNRPDFPSAILRPGETYEAHVSWLFEGLA